MTPKPQALTVVSPRGMRRVLLATTALVAMAALPANAQDLPTNGQVVAGTATIQTAGQDMTVTTATQRTVIDWKSFSVTADHRLSFNQPDAASIAVNRVIGTDPSKIFGTITSNGRVVIANPNGIWFGPSARVDVAGVVASAGRIGDPAVASFMRGGALTIDAGHAGASVVNDGIITARDGGFAALVAPGVRNTGTITARLGRVALASGGTTTVDFYGDGLINLAVGGVADSVPLDGAVTNSGRIYAEGGQVRLSASVAEGLLNNVINMSGVIEARGVSTAGGVVELLGGTGSVDVSGRIDVRGADTQSGGRITVRAGDATTRGGVANLTGTLDAGSAAGMGGTIDVAARLAYLGGRLAADGATGGGIDLAAIGITQAGSVTANGTTGGGGAVTLAGAQNITQTTTALTSASSTAGSGGTVVARAGAAGRVFSSGTLTATGATGGLVSILGNDIALAAATADASGTTGKGGAVLVGGDLHGTGAQTAATTLVNGAVTLRADGGTHGDGGRVVVWSNSRTDYEGNASARGGAIAGNGGMIEVSSSDLLNFGGSGDASAAAGKAGSLLLDPKNIVISETTGGLAVFDLIDPNAGIGTGFGDTTAQLANGTIVVTKPGDTVGGAANAGSVYYYDPYNGALLSTFQGSHANDRVGSGTGGTTGLRFLDPNATYDATSGVPIYDNAKAYLIHSPGWNGNAGALTWVASNGMASGIVGSTNSLVGSSAGDLVGSMDYVSSSTFDILSSGNVLVRSPNWGGGRGALTFIDAATGIVGAVSGANSLTGTLTSAANGNGRRGDSLGSDGIVTLANGDVVVRSGYWNRMGGALTYVGASSGLGALGTLGSANSLVGNAGVTYSATNQYAFGGPAPYYGFYNGDNVGNAGITQLSNGDLVIASANWGHGRGAVTYASGAAGLTGLVSSSNSLVGVTKGIGDTSDGTDTYFTDTYGYRGWYGGDNVGSGGVTELANGGFVISSPNWSTNRGATTFYVSGTTGLSGTISASTSLTGTTAGTATGYDGFHRQTISGGDLVGAVTALANGNYVVSASRWNNARGSVTVLDGTTGQALAGSSGSRGDTVSASNSLVGGTANDQVGLGIVKLNGTSDVVATAREWGNGKGAVTRVSGSAGMAAVVSSTNSLVGTTAYETSPLGGDNVGSSVTALSNGAYVILSPNWNKTRGAATFVPAGGAITGTISSGNSLVGTTGAEGNAIYCASCSNGNPAMFGGDYVGSGGVTVLGNGNLLLASPNWSQQRGAITFINGTTGALVDGTASLTGPVSATNSLVGTQAAARYVSSYNYYGSNTVGLRYWVGGDQVGSIPEGAGAPVELIGSDRFLLINTNWHNRTGAITLGKSDGTFAAGGVFAGQVGAANSLVGTTASTLYTPPNLAQGNYALQYDGDRLGSERYKVLADGRIAIFSPNWSGTRGAIALMDGTTGLVGVVSASNSVVGTLAGDQVGYGGTYSTYELANGKTLFVNPYAVGSAGAATELAAGAAFTGTLDATNSLVGAAPGDLLGVYGVILLAGNRYIINSSYAGAGQSAITYHDGTTPLTGTLDLRNSFYGDAALPTSYGLGYGLAATGSLLMNFNLEGSGRVTLGFADPTGWTYARAAQSTLTIAPSLIERSLNNGTSLVLQASNDITINSAIAASGGATGNLTLEAGRSIVGNADIGLGTGNLSLLANSTLANGVVDAQRDGGHAAITLTGTTIATTGAVSIQLAASTDKTNNGAGDIALGTISAGTVDVRNLGSANGALTLNGAITATGANTSVLLATGGAFVNNGGASALSPGAGRFLVYSADPRNNTLGGLSADGKFYGRTLAANPPASLSATDDLFLYSVVPVLTVTGNTTVGYGDAAGGVTPTVTGFIDGDTRLIALAGAASISTSYQAGDAVGGTYALTIGQGTLTSPLGYAINLVNGTVTVTPKVLTLALTGSVTKQYDRTSTAALTQGNLQLTGLYGSDSIAIGATSGSYATANVGTNLNVTTSLSAGDFTAAAGTLLSNYVLPTGSTSATIGTITARALTLSGLAAIDRTYDGTTAVALTGGTLSGVLSGDAIGVNAGTGTLADRNVGTGKAVSLSNFTLTGAAAGNYTISQPVGLTATITAKQLALGGVTAQGRAYDGTTAITLTGGTLSGVVGSDTVGVVGGGGTSASRNAGTHAVTAAGFALNGSDAANYVLAGQPTGLTATITPLAVTLAGVNAVNRSYDGTTAVTLTSGVVAGLLVGDAVSLVQGTASVANRNVGIGKTVSVTGFALSGADAVNYTLGGVPASLSVDIAARALSISGLAAQDRVYDGTTTVALTGGTLSGAIGGDVVGLSVGSGMLADRNVGVGKTVSLGGFGLTGADAGNYVISQPSGLTATITAKQLALTGVTTQARAYDGTTNVALAGGTLSGVIGGDTVGFTNGIGIAASKDAGTQAVTASGFALHGADAGNYALAGQPTGLSVAIARRAVSLSGVSAIDRTYDGTTSVALTDGAVSGLLSGDAVSLVQGVGSMADRHVGTAKTVSVTGFQLNGADAANYALGGVPGTLSVDIAARAISLAGLTALDRSYDGTTQVALSGGTLSGVIGSDTVGVVTGTGSLADRHVGTAKAVTVSGFGLNGADAGNYVLAGQPSGLTATITTKQLALTGVTTQARAYDGTTNVALAGGTLSGVIGGDTVGFTNGAGIAASKDAGTQAVTASGFALNGADAGNYALAGQPTGLSVAIDPARLLVSLVAGAASKTYDASAAATLTSASYRIQGVVAGESIGIAQTAGSFASANAGTALSVTVSLGANDYVAGAGTSLANYALPTGSMVGAVGTILPAALMVRADDQIRMSGDPMSVLTASYSGFVGSDTAASTGIAPTLSTDATVQSPAGSYAITASGGQLANYVVTYRAGTMTVTPAPVPVPLQALIATQPLQAVIAAPVGTPSTTGEVAISTGVATAFLPAPPAVPLTVGHANATLTSQDRSVQGANDYANSFVSSLKLESRK